MSKIQKILSVVALVLVGLQTPILAVPTAYETAISTGLGEANTAGIAVLTAGAVIVVSLIVWSVIKKFAHAAK